MSSLFHKLTDAEEKIRQAYRVDGLDPDEEAEEGD